MTSRLVLRRMMFEDLDFMATMLGDPEVMKFYPRTYDRDGAGEWIGRMLKRYESDGFGLWLVLDRKANEPRGQVGVLRQEVEGRSLIEVGYMIHRPFWRQGIASEAALACRDWAFDTLNIEAVHSLIRPVNLPSQAVARKMGMQPLPQTVQFHAIEHQLFRVEREETQRADS
jgi:RimJ/RimL family protein N-acetyltransferase